MSNTWNGRPHDSPERIARESFFYGVLEDWEQRGLVKRVMRPASETAVPDCSLQASRTDREHEATATQHA